MDTSPSPYKMIETEEACKTALDVLSKTEMIAIDTEFVRERTYYPIPALIQISDGTHIYLFDTINCKMDQLGNFLASSDQIKIVHSGSQDLEIFEIICSGRRLSHIVDTQIAAQFLMMDQCLGLGNLISECFNIEINKSQTVSNWVARPLSQKQLEYAAEDVLYLHRIYHLLKQKLSKVNKWDIFLEECEFQNRIKDPVESLMEKHSKPSDSEKFKALLKDLIVWREDMAKHKNLPRTWILKDFQLKKIAKQSNPKLWLQTETLTEKQIHNFGRVFSRFHEEHEHLSSKSQTMSLKDRHLFEKCHGIIKKKITNIAAKHDIPTEMICNQRQLKSKVLQMIDERRFVGFDGWRGQLLNTPLGDVFKSFENQHFTD